MQTTHKRCISIFSIQKNSCDLAFIITEWSCFIEISAFPEFSVCFVK